VDFRFRLKRLRDSTIPRELRDILLAATLIYVFSVWEHLPGLVPSHYTDIASVFYREGIGQGPHLIPYYDFTFEYPLLVGVFVYLCSSVRIWVANFSQAMAYYTVLMNLILYAFTMGTIVTLYRIVVKVKGEVSRMWKCFLVMPSYLMFVTYNWDIVAIFFSTLALHYFLKGEKGKADLSVGLGIAAKLFPAMLVPVFMVEEKTWPQRLKRLAAPLLVFLALNTPFILANFNRWFDTWRYHAQWGIEDSWLIFFFNQMDPNAHYAALAVLLYLVYKGLADSGKRSYASGEERIITRVFLMYAAWLFGNYVVTPQMALILLPLFVLLPSIPLPAIYAAEVFNALIIVLWFTPELNLGNPLIASSPVQWFSAIRQVIWLTLFIYMLYPDKVRRWTQRLLERVET
jgi:uncharacterized membrane protein